VMHTEAAKSFLVATSVLDQMHARRSSSPPSLASLLRMANPLVAATPLSALDHSDGSFSIR